MPLIVFETKISNARVVLQSFGFEDFIDVPAVGTRGGLIFAWFRSLSFYLHSQNACFLNLIVFSDLPHRPWMLTLLRGPTYWSEKEVF